MAERYDLTMRSEAHKNREKLIAVLKNNGYTDEELLRIADCAAGRTQSGKEAAAGMILALAESGSDKQAVWDYLDTIRFDKYPIK